MIQAFSCEFFGISKNTFFHRTPPLAASVKISYLFHFQQKNETEKGNTLMEFKYLLSCSRIELFDVKDFKINSADGT